jgi:stringent starvation protein B
VADDPEMTSSRPYFIRALYDWLVDNGMTPHLLVNAKAKGVQVPTSFVENGQLVLNVSPNAVKGLSLGNDLIRFNARFGGTPMDVRVPPHAVLGIYARENGRGMLFPEEDEGDPQSGPEDEGPDKGPDVKGGRARLRVVK